MENERNAQAAAQPAEEKKPVEEKKPGYPMHKQIGRASCRERVLRLV